ncbi:MAG: ATP-dependent RNA helicase DbpA [Bdellovibrionota bacterium]
MHKDNIKSLGLRPELQKSLDLFGFSKLTEIQAKALPEILEGNDIIAQAPTGSGKTLAFGLGVLSDIIIADYYIQSLILCPTRELATQVATEIRKLARFSENLKVLLLCGGTPIAPQINSLEHGAHIIVGTPGRVLDHLSKRTLKISAIKTLVLDEADRMLDMGFGEDIRKIINRTPERRQTLLFSATFPDDIKAMSNDIQRNPSHVMAQATVQNSDIEQLFFESKKEERYDLLLALYAEYRPESSIVFCTTKIQCDEVARFLRECGLTALAIHSDLEQEQREEVMVRFANKSASILVATDVAARGLDVKDLNAVINFELSKDPEVHVHRIGRTGRAGQKGLALSIYNRSEMFRIKAIEELMQIEVQKKSLFNKLKNNKLDLKPEMATLKIFAGKKNKLRPGDILGALVKEAGIEGKYIGKIHTYDHISYVAIHKNHMEIAHSRLSNAKIKNRRFRLQILR